MEELGTENTDFLSIFESARTSIIKELDKIKLQYHLDKVASSKNSERIELSQKQTKDKAKLTEIESQDNESDHLKEQANSKIESHKMTSFFEVRGIDFDDNTQLKFHFFELLKKNDQLERDLFELWLQKAELAKNLSLEQFEKEQLKKQLKASQEERIRLMKKLTAT